MLPMGRFPSPRTEEANYIRIYVEPGAGYRLGAGGLGAPLGRQELQVSFATLMDRFPNLELVEEPRWKPNYVIRGLQGLVVRP